MLHIFRGDLALSTLNSISPLAQNGLVLSMLFMDKDRLAELPLVRIIHDDCIHANLLKNGVRIQQ